MELSELVANRRTVILELGDGKLEVSYRPQVITVDFLRGNHPERDDAEWLAEVVDGWDLTDGGEPVGTDEESIRAKVPTELLAPLVLGILGDARSGGSRAARASGGRRAAGSETLPGSGSGSSETPES